MNHHCRIGKIIYKKSPHLSEIRPAPRGLNIAGEMHRNLDIMLDYFSEGTAGAVAVVWGFDGSFSRVTRYHKDSPVGQTMLPSFISEVLRRDTMTELVREEKL